MWGSSTGLHGHKRSHQDEQLRHDRFVAMVVIAIIIALAALMTWLSSVGGDTTTDFHYYWL